MVGGEEDVGTRGTRTVKPKETGYVGSRRVIETLGH